MMKNIVNSRVKPICTYFPNYSEEQVLAAIQRLSIEDRIIIELRYGLNGREVTSVEDIEKKFEMSSCSLYQKIKRIHKRIVAILEDPEHKNETVKFFETFAGYSEQQVLDAMELLDETTRKVLELRYGLNGNPVTEPKVITEKLGIAGNGIYQKINFGKKKVIDILRGPNENKEAIKFFSCFPGYTKEQVLDALEYLTIENRKIIELSYGLNGNRVTSARDIAEQLHINYHPIRQRINLAKKRIQKLLSNTSYMKKENKFYTYFPNYTKEQVQDALEQLSKVDQKILELRFGLNGEKVISVSSIASKFNVDHMVIYQKIRSLKKKVRKILQFIPNKQGADKFYSHFSNYTKEQILEALNYLHPENKKLLELRYGLNGETVCSLEEVADRFNNNYHIIYQRIIYSVNKVEQILQALFKYDEDFTKKKNMPEILERLNASESEIEVIDLFAEEISSNGLLSTKEEGIMGSDEDRQRNAIKNLIGFLTDVTEQTVLLMRLGYNANRIFYSEKQIGYFLNMDENEVHQIIHNAINNLSKLDIMIPEIIDNINKQLTKV